MSQRKELWDDHREDAGRALCPFCGSQDVHYNNHFKTWQCPRCNKSFPSPSYGTGDIRRWPRKKRPSEMTPQEQLKELYRTGAIKEVDVKDPNRTAVRKEGKDAITIILAVILLVIISIIIYLAVFGDKTS